LGLSLNAFAVAVTVTLGVWPNTRNWLLDHPALGWLLVLAFAVATAVLGQVLYHQRGAHARVASENDARLLAEWLGDWRQGGDFIRWLDVEFLSFRLPSKSVRDIEHRIEAWTADKRELADPELARLFSATVEAAKQFITATWETWEDHEGRLEVPIEWKGTQHDRYYAACQAMSDGRDRLLDALTSLLAAMHKRGLPT
jgi:hypothetical protein